MRLAEKLLGSLASTIVLASAASAATITGTVQGPDGKPFMGAFVTAENPQSKMTVNVLSDAQGHYRIPNLPAATYTVGIATSGYKSDPHTGVALAADGNASFDFALQKTPVRWTDLSTWQGRQLLPKTAKHDLTYNDQFFVTCWQSCHSFQKRMAPNAFDHDGWEARVKYMSETMLEGRHLSDQTIEDYTSFLTTMFGPNSPKPASPEDLPQIQIAGAGAKPQGHEHRVRGIRFCRPERHGAVERGRGQGRQVLDSLLWARQ